MSNRSYELTEALSRLIAIHPFYAVLLCDLLTVVESESVPTAATDGQTMWINPRFFRDELKDADERLFVLAHEVLHVVFRHCPRLKLYMDRGFGPDMKPFSAERWNKATDFIINDTLHQDKIGTIPDMALYNPKYTHDMLADDVYKQLKDDPNKKRPHAGHMPSDDDTMPDPAKVKRAIASAAQAAKAQGSVPGTMQRLVDELLAPQITWGEYLRMQIQEKAGRDSSTWSKLNRRRLVMPPHIPFPGTTGHAAGNIVAYVDTSGSVSQAELTCFMSEIAGIYQDTSPESLLIGCVDSEAYDPMEITTVDDIDDFKYEGGGGTHMPAVYPKLEELDIQPDILVILTDGYTGWDTEPPYPVVVVSTSDRVCPYGVTIRLNVVE